MKTGSFTCKLFPYLVIIILLIGMAASAYSQDNSVLRVVPEKTLIYLRLASLIGFEEKLEELINSLNIPNAPSVSADQIINKITKMGIPSLTQLEDSGFDMKGDACIFWTSLSLDKPSIAVSVKSKEAAEEAVLNQMNGTYKKHRGITYGENETAAWVFLDDVFVYTKSPEVIMTAIEVHLKESQSILQSEKHGANFKSIREGDISAYVALEEIVSSVLPLLMMQSDRLKQTLSAQMNQQGQAAVPGMKLNPTKILGMEIDIGIWLLQQIKSYGLSIGLARDGIWFNDSLKFKADSPIRDYLNIKPQALEIVDYLPGDVLVAGGITIDAEVVEKFNSVMFKTMMPLIKDQMPEANIDEIWEKYESAIKEINSCLGDSIAFSVSTKSDKMMPRAAYILDIVDEDKARRTLGNLDYMRDIWQPFYDTFGMDIPMVEGPTQQYNGVQIESFQIDMSQMKGFVPNAGNVYPEKVFLWYAFVKDKMIYTMSQSADTIKETIDALNGRTAGIANSPNFEDIKIHLPGKSNMVMYISPMGYLSFVMNMMTYMNQGAAGGNMLGSIKPGIGFAVSTNLEEDGIRNFTYLIVKEIQQLIAIGMSFGQMMNSQGNTQ